MVKAEIHLIDIFLLSNALAKNMPITNAQRVEAYSFFLWKSLTFGQNLVRQLIKYYLKGMRLSRLQIAFRIGKDWQL